jgi:hypothetical protein
MNQLQIIYQASSYWILQFSCPLVANPNVYTSSARKDVHEIMQIVIFFQCDSDNLNGDNEEFPALLAYSLTLTAISDIIVVVHIEVENQLPFLSFSKRFFLGDFTPNGPSIHLDRYLLKSRHHSFPH